MFPESQNRHPAPLENLTDSAVPVAVASILAFHHSPLDFGAVPWMGQPCQKHPSRKTTTRRPDHDVTAEGRSGLEFAVDTVAVAAGVKPAPDLQPDLGAGRLLSPHLSSNLFSWRRAERR